MYVEDIEIILQSFAFSYWKYFTFSSSYDVVDNANSKVEYTDDVNVDEEASTEEVIIIQEEQQFEPKKVKPEVKPVVAKIELPVESKKVYKIIYASTFKRIIVKICHCSGNFSHLMCA